MGFMVVARKKMAGIGGGVGAFFFGLASIVLGAIYHNAGVIALGGFIILIGVIAGLYLWRRADREVGSKIT